ncbi:hypothetical protein ZIOFF_069497 [Zingiber officinale]|uniref:RING-CH-type domain-containing protein n=1 Tax=Zingiber officinale TaxID=94328 RepID=A0A8J5ECS3_ZINOF|nr:hypothetical protein ZIOFF_069497 [Zingiber officinale]
METGEGQEIRLRRGDHDPAVAAASSVRFCRICHEEEEEGSATMESPCACSGTLKFAHRECTQRWCDEKGNAVCEICLQEFEPGYTIAEKKALVDVGVTIRGSLEVPRLNYDPHNPEFVPYNDTDSDECSPASRRRASYFRSVALIKPGHYNDCWGRSLLCIHLSHCVPAESQCNSSAIVLGDTVHFSISGSTAARATAALPCGRDFLRAQGNIGALRAENSNTFMTAHLYHS